MSRFEANCLPLLIGSLPLSDHEEATRLIFDYTPEIPIWPQLPAYREEGMLLQFLPGFPGKTDINGKVFIDTASPGFNAELLAFYEEYIMVTEGGADLETSRFALTPETAKGFFTFLQQTGLSPVPATALKGQITGPDYLLHGNRRRERAGNILQQSAQGCCRQDAGLEGQVADKKNGGDMRNDIDVF